MIILRQLSFRLLFLKWSQITLITCKLKINLLLICWKSLWKLAVILLTESIILLPSEHTLLLFWYGLYNSLQIAHHLFHKRKESNALKWTSKVKLTVLPCSPCFSASISSSMHCCKSWGRAVLRSYPLHHLNYILIVKKSEQNMLSSKLLKEHQHLQIQITLIKLRCYIKLQTPLELQKAASV